MPSRMKFLTQRRRTTINSLTIQACHHPSSSQRQEENTKHLQKMCATIDHPPPSVSAKETNSLHARNIFAKCINDIRLINGARNNIMWKWKAIRCSPSPPQISDEDFSLFLDDRCWHEETTQMLSWHTLERSCAILCVRVFMKIWKHNAWPYMETDALRSPTREETSPTASNDENVEQASHLTRSFEPRGEFLISGKWFEEKIFQWKFSFLFAFLSSVVVAVSWRNYSLKLFHSAVTKHAETVTKSPPSNRGNLQRASGKFSWMKMLSWRKVSFDLWLGKAPAT